MEIKIIFALISAFPVICTALPTAVEQEYRIEAFQKDGDSQTLVLRIHPKSDVNNRQPRQDEGDDDDDSSTSAPGPATTPFIPAVIPALTQIFQGLITGNLNDIFHGSTAFAPQNVSYAIDSVYNQVVGIAPPVSTHPTTRRPPPTEASAPVEPPTQAPEAAPVVQSSQQAAPSASAAPSVPVQSAGQPLNQGSVVITTSTPKASTVLDEDDEEDSDNFFFGRFRNPPKAI